MSKKGWALGLTLFLSLCFGAKAFAAAGPEDYLKAQVTAPTHQDIGGEWTVIALNERGDKRLNSVYLNNLSDLLAKGISTRKYTDYARIVLALVSMGEDPEAYGVLQPLTDTDAVLRQGVNGAAYALMALDAAGSGDPARQVYRTYLLKRQLADGGFALSGETADPDVTAMVLQALAPYGEGEEGFAALSALQQPSGGFQSHGKETAESAAQVLLALTAWDIPVTDARYGAVLEALEAYRTASGGFRHTLDGEANLMATEQVSRALTAYEKQAAALPQTVTLGWYEGAAS